MIIIKAKSLIVSVISSLVIAAVLVLTLVGYLVYIEFKGEEFRRIYEAQLQKISARVYGKYIDIQRLNAKIEDSGALKGKPVVEGVLINKGRRPLANILIKVKFLDTDGTVIYDTVFRPQEPALAVSTTPLDIIPYLSGHGKTYLRPADSFPFKVLLFNCPGEIWIALKEKAGHAKTARRWRGKLAFEILAVDI